MKSDWRRYYIAVFDDGSCPKYLARTQSWAVSIGQFLYPSKKVIGVLGVRGKNGDVQQLLWRNTVYL